MRTPTFLAVILSVVSISSSICKSQAQSISGQIHHSVTDGFSEKYNEALGDALKFTNENIRTPFFFAKALAAASSSMTTQFVTISNLQGNVYSKWLVNPQGTIWIVEYESQGYHMILPSMHVYSDAVNNGSAFCRFQNNAQEPLICTRHH